MATKKENRYIPQHYGIGYIGDVKSKGNTNAYNMWSGIFKRCYDLEYQNRQPTYKNCEICVEWHDFSNFEIWYNNNYYTVNDESMQLDKDILVKGNKIYSPNTCIIVPKNINNLFAFRKLNKKHLLGIKITRNKKYEARLSINNTYKHLGTYNTELEAFNVYKIAKENHIKYVADSYKDMIPNKLYNALYDYIIEVTD